MGFRITQKTDLEIVFEMQRYEDMPNISYEILDYFPPDEKRQRTSIVVKSEEGYTFYCRSSSSEMLDKIIFQSQAQRQKVTEYYNKCISEGHKVTFFCGNEIRAEDYHHFKQTCSQFEPYSDDEMSAVNWFEEKLFYFIGLTVCGLLSLNKETEEAFKSL